MPPINGMASLVGSSRSRASRPLLIPVIESGGQRSSWGSAVRSSDGTVRLSVTKKWRILMVLIGITSITATIVYSVSSTTGGLLGTLVTKRFAKVEGFSLEGPVYSPEELKAAECNQPPDDWSLPAKNTGYLLVRCNGGLNQMRAAICDMVAVARLLNATMVIPELDKTSFWADPSDFPDVFDVEHFIASLSGEVRVIKGVPPHHQHRVASAFTMDPISWSNVNYYSTIVYPLLSHYKVLRLNHSDSRVANNVPDIPVQLQKLRCRVNYHALQFKGPIRELGNTIIRRLMDKGPFIALHLRYEMDMLSFTGCTYGCTKREEHKLTRLRMRTERWKEKVIDGAARRMEGLCPMTPEEVSLMLRAMGYDKDMQVYVASGRIYGGKRRMARLLKLFPNAVRKEMLATEEELGSFRNHSSQMAALDYMVSVASDVFVSTFQGNMASLVEGHRRYLGHRRTIAPDRKKLVALFEGFEKGELDWAQLSQQVQEAHANRLGAPSERLVIPGHPKEEDNFWSNPFECMCQEDKGSVEKPPLRILPEPEYLEEERRQRLSSRSTPSVDSIPAIATLPRPREPLNAVGSQNAGVVVVKKVGSVHEEGKDVEDSEDEGRREGIGREGDGLSESSPEALTEWGARVTGTWKTSREVRSGTASVQRTMQTVLMDRDK